MVCNQLYLKTSHKSLLLSPSPSPCLHFVFEGQHTFPITWQWGCLFQEQRAAQSCTGTGREAGQGEEGLWDSSGACFAEPQECKLWR